MKDKSLLVVSILFFLVFFAGIIYLVLSRPTSSILKAKNAVPSADKSFAVIYPQVGKSMKVTVTIRDANGEAIPSREVRITSSMASVEFAPSDHQITDTNGQTDFTLTSSATGTAQLSIMDVGSNIAVSNIPSVEFTP
jgi:hypothetical protein